MKALLIHQGFVSPEQGGGTRHYEMASRMVKAGHEFAIVASDTNYQDGKSTTSGKSWVEVEQVDGITVLRAYTYPSLHKSYLWRVISFLSFMFTSVMAGLKAGQVDLVMGTTPPIFQAVSAWLVSVFRRCPFLLEVRDLWPEFAIDIGLLKNPVLIWLFRRLENFLYARATHILVNSPAYKDYLLSKGVKEAKISVIPNGVDPDMFVRHVVTDTRNFRQEFQLDGKYVATYAGALGMANDIDTILNAAHLVTEESIHFLIVGDGKERTRLEKLVSQLQLTNVTFTGSVPKKQMIDVLEASDVCLATLQDIPMFRTVYPNKVFDYMAASKPIVLGIDGVIRDVVESANGGLFVKPGNPKALADAVMKMAADRDAAEQMGHSGREYVVKFFNRNEHAKDLESLMCNVANKAA